MKITKDSEYGLILRRLLHLAKFKNKNLEDDKRDWDVTISDTRGEAYTALCELEGTPPKAQVVFSLEIKVFPHVYIGDIRSNQMYKLAVPKDLLDDFSKLQDAIAYYAQYQELALNAKEIKCYYFMPADYLFDVLSKDEMKVSLPEKCNDPLEFMAAGRNEITKPGGFISFSSRCDSSLMWAHYAKSHTGACLEFTFPVQTVKPEFSGPTNHRSTTVACELKLDHIEQFATIHGPQTPVHKALLIRVIYSERRPAYDMTNSSLRGPSGLMGYHFSSEYYTKSVEWKYEKEWRLLVMPHHAQSFHDGNFFVTGLTKYLTGIILGKNFAVNTNTAAAMIVQSLKSNPHFKTGDLSMPDMKRAAFDDDEYKIIM